MTEMNNTGYLTYVEIMRQQQGWEKILDYFRTYNSGIKTNVAKFIDSKWIFTGCGTSYYIAQSASYAFSKITGIPSVAVASSEIIISPEIVFTGDEKYVLIPISRSGTTTEAILAAKKANELNIETLAISCTEDSPLVKECKTAVTFPFEEEKSVVMTGSFTSMYLAVVYISLLIENNPDNPIWAQLANLSPDSSSFIERNEKYISAIGGELKFNDFVFLGQNVMTGIANEAALKMQEMTISTSQGYHTLEYRHGPKSTVSESSLVTLMITDQSFDWEKPIINELRDLGASVFTLYSLQNEKALGFSDFSLKVPENYSDILKPFFVLVALQLLGFFRALAKGLNPDSPKNLTQVVKL